MWWQQFAEAQLGIQLLCTYFIIPGFTAHYDVDLVCEHIAGVVNTTADHLSRNNNSLFCFVFSQNTDASLLPTPLPAPLLQITIHLSYSDVVVDSKISPSMVFLHIKQSMTDTTREGAQVVLGLTGKEACPAKVLLPYVYGSQGCTTRPLFITADNHYLTQPLFRSALHPLLKLCAEWFNTHSF